MQREPDWEALSELNFLLSHRITEPLNAALSAIELSEIGDKSGKPADWWRDRARTQISSVLNLFTAWSWLVQYKTGMQFPEKAIRPFDLQTLLDWLTIHLQIVPPLQTPKNVMVNANQETLQEGILLLYSVASTQGSGAKIIVDLTPSQITFRIRYARLRQTKQISTLENLIESLGQHWRMQVIAFELKTARDFLALNKCALELNDTGSTVEFVFSARPTGGKVLALSPAQELQKKIATKITHAALSGVMAEGHVQTDSMPKVATVNLASAQSNITGHWHLPSNGHRIQGDSRPTKPAPKVVPAQPTRTGSWHSPLTTKSVTVEKRPAAVAGVEVTPPSTPIVVSLPLPDVEPPDFLKSQWRGQELEFAIPEKSRTLDLRAIGIQEGNDTENKPTHVSTFDTIEPEEKNAPTFFEHKSAPQA